MLLHTENLTKYYGRHRALVDLNLDIRKGEIFGLLGPNGSGKSTALRLLMGFIRPTRGRATIGGHDCWRDSLAARRLSAYLPGELRLYDNMSGKKLIEFLSGLRNEYPGLECDRLAKQFDIDISRGLAGLSSGMKRKVALMQVLLPKVPLVIMDEPTNTLDPSMREELLAQLRAAREQGQTVLFSSHVLQEVEQVADRVGILSKGKLVHLQSMEELRAAHQVYVKFDDHESVETVPEIGGLSVQSHENGELRFVMRSELSPLLNWLGNKSVQELRVEPLGLSSIYAHHHGEAA